MGDYRKNCPNCGLKYSKEPGFYQGAMYVSYGLGVAVFVMCWVGTAILYPAYTPELLIAIVLGTIFLTAPYLFALSKIIWANLFMHYKGKAAGKNRSFGEHETTA